MSRSPVTSGEVLEALDKVVADRRTADPSTSYVAALCSKGLGKVQGKLGEECAEAVAASCGPEPDLLVHEVADVWFHSLVLLHLRGRCALDVLTELARRFGLSGIEEHQRRKGIP